MYDPTFLPEESDDLLDFFDLVDEDEPLIAQPFSRALSDVAYEQGLGEFQLREMVERAADRGTIAINGKHLHFRKDEQGEWWLTG
jgi:hypothetical protein